MSENATSMKGLKGTVGAPLKPVVWPDAPFTKADFFATNADQCEPTLASKIKKAIGPVNGQGNLFELTPYKVAGTVGASKCVYVRREKFDAATMKLRERKVKEAPVVVDVVATATAPVMDVVADPAVEPAATVNVVVAATDTVVVA